MTTKRSYEDQLSMMSDHLCSMNETLTKQREEIDTLKMASKGNSKKNKNRQFTAESLEAAAAQDADSDHSLSSSCLFQEAEAGIGSSKN